MRLIRTAILTTLAVGTLLVASGGPADAQGRVPGWGAYETRGEAYENGYRRGYQNGAADSRSRRQSDVRRDREYRDGDWGYDRRYGTRDAYRRMFREGFEAGYADGYRGRGRLGDRRQLPQAPGYPGARDDRYGNYGNYGNRASSQVAFNYGYNDGYERGLKAARDRQAFDPYREGWYRDGDRHYDRDFGPREYYRQTYREGFLRGYEEAYGGNRLFRR